MSFFYASRPLTTATSIVSTAFTRFTSTSSSSNRSWYVVSFSRWPFAKDGAADAFDAVEGAPRSCRRFAASTRWPTNWSLKAVLVVLVVLALLPVLAVLAVLALLARLAAEGSLQNDDVAGEQRGACGAGDGKTDAFEKHLADVLDDCLVVGVKVGGREGVQTLDHDDKVIGGEREAEEENGDGAGGGGGEGGGEEIGEKEVCGGSVVRGVWELDPVPEKATGEIGEETRSKFAVGGC